MAEVSVTFKLNQSELRRMNLPGGLVHQGVSRGAQRLRDLAIREITTLGAVDSGAMRSSMTYEIKNESPTKIVARVGPDIGQLPGSVDYPIIVHQGRGPVVPRRARVLRFKPKGGSRVIYRPRVGRAAPKPFLTNALKKLQPGALDP